MTEDRCIFRKYHSLERRIAREIEDTMDSQRFKELLALQRRCFPTKEEVIETLEAFFKEEPEELNDPNGINARNI